MKFLFLLLVMGSAAHAFPAVGDYAFLTTADGYSKEAEVLSYDKITKKFRARYTDRIFGKIDSVEYRTYTFYETWNSQWIESLIAQCAEFGGEFESVHLEKLGNYETCKFENPDSGEYYNAGRPPFGVVQGELWSSDGQMKYYTLQEYRFGI